jgi:hypothetical protein
MSKLNDAAIVEVSVLPDDALMYAFAPSAVNKDVKIRADNLRGKDRVETLKSKTLNDPATAKPAYVTTLQLVSAKLTKLLRGSGNLAPGVLAANTDATVTLTVVGLAVGDHVIVHPTAALDAGLVISHGWVSAADTLSVRMRNCGAVATAGTAIPVTLLAITSFAPDP